MRVRFYPVGNGSRRAVVLDELPIEMCDVVGDESCGGRFDGIDGTLVLVEASDGSSVRLNGVGLSHGPVLPGDRLSVGNREFVVSYERTTSELPAFASYLLRDGARPNAPV